ncbi:hypothetical protein CCR75_006584 [Bremia lactucae]|uniref:Pentacotripeptide-repeat region of PRORP domain-containing protein n=1 Tax=Bremia lactucae TaxID=4779 RepID=A0A976FHR6_BRELC|nr:hypothetical protein CCR75_006584 [Bremia lactucae]
MLRRAFQLTASWQSRPLLLRSYSSRHLRKAPQLRYKDERIGILLSYQTISECFVLACRDLRSKDEIELLSATDSRAWNVALQQRLEKRDEQGAAELLGLVAHFARENTSELVWTDLLFTVLRQRSARNFRSDEIFSILNQLKKRYGPYFVASVLNKVINGCANIKMMTAGHELLLYHQSLWAAIRENEPNVSSKTPLMEPSIVGTLMSKMTRARKYEQVLDLATAYLNHFEFIAERDFQQQGFLALFKASVKTRRRPHKIVHTFLNYVEESVRARGEALDRIQNLSLERGFGAAIQCCVAQEEFSLALHCYATMESTRTRLLRDTIDSNIEIQKAEEKAFTVDAVLPADENIYVNVMKACSAVKDFMLLKEVFQAMTARGVARSAGFGSAIRYCHEHLDSNFLEEVLEKVLETEADVAGAWMLQINHYNDALGCFAATGRSEQAKELFTRLWSNSSIVPDHITMLEMVENYRNASIEEVFALMDAFLERQLAPNLQVLTSLLSICMRQRIVGDAVALIDGMEKYGIVLDIKAFTSIAFIHASHGDIKAIVSVLRDMTTNCIPFDSVFFKYVMNALYESSGIDLCFELLRELNHENRAIPEGLYISLIDLGTRIGLIERTLHVAYNMECEGYHVSTQQLHNLLMRCQSKAEIVEYLRTFSLLHQGRQLGMPRFEMELYKDLCSRLTRFNCKDHVEKVQMLARSAGHDDEIV